MLCYDQNFSRYIPTVLTNDAVSQLIKPQITDNRIIELVLEGNYNKNDILYVKEAWRTVSAERAYYETTDGKTSLAKNQNKVFDYLANYPICNRNGAVYCNGTEYTWQDPNDMPEEAARILLWVNDVHSDKEGNRTYVLELYRYIEEYGLGICAECGLNYDKETRQHFYSEADSFLIKKGCNDFMLISCPGSGRSFKTRNIT